MLLYLDKVGQIVYRKKTYNLVTYSSILQTQQNNQGATVNPVYAVKSVYSKFKNTFHTQ